MNTESLPSIAQKLASEARLEISSPEGREVLDASLRQVPKGRTLTITTTEKVESAVSLAVSLRTARDCVIPHIAASRLQNLAALEWICNRLESGNIDQIFVVAGDKWNDGAAFPSTIDLLRTLPELGAKFSRIGVAGYPEGHAKIDVDTLMWQLKLKEQFSHEYNAQMYIVSQMCLNPEKVIQWVEFIRSEKIDLPVVVGVPAKVSIRRLMSFASQAKLGNALEFMRTKYDLTAGPVSFDPEDYLNKLSQMIRPEHNIEGIHLYTFNNILPTMRWINDFSQTGQDFTN